MPLKIQFYPDGETGYVSEYLESLRLNPNRKKAHDKIKFDLALLAAEGLGFGFLDIKRIVGAPGSVWELRRPYQGIAYRIYFCVIKGEVWLLHFLEKETAKIPLSDLQIIRKRSQEVFARKR